MHRPVVVSVGSINVDLVLLLDGPPKGTMEATGDIRAAGGKAANVAVLAARLGLGSRLVGQVGDDEDAGLALAGPRRAGVDLQGVVVVDEPTGFSVVLVEPAGGKTIVRRPGANVAAAGEVCLDGGADVVVVDLEVSRSYVDAAVDLARRRGAALIVDPAPAAALDAGLLAVADVITPDHAEAATITGITTDDRAGALAAAVELHDRGAATAMVKLAQGGCAVASATVQAIIEPPPMVIVDTNGSGDAFAGAVAWARALGHGVLDSAAAGVAAATIVGSGLGGQDPLPDVPMLREVIERVGIERLDPSASR